MESFKIKMDDFDIKEYNSIIIGAGAAGLNCALHLVTEGIDPDKIAIVTDQLGGGTSFNTGSDKQTYYKMSIVGKQLDSPYQMAKDLCAGGAMHGDIALIEATNSIREFFHLIQLGVPFPHDKFGGFVGYTTDYDPRQRATSIGPFTSQEMCNCLLKAVQKENINFFDKHYATKILIDKAKPIPEAIGIICVNIGNLSKKKDFENIKDSIVIFKARNIILATGGPARLYKDSVYPESQNGTFGLAIDAGCRLQNLTESQFGLASVKFRWNVSGSYQQVIPRYFSKEKNDQEREFLKDYFPSFKELSTAIFLKGYQWPFNAERIENFGSSIIDLAVYYEIEILGRNVFLDFRKNPLEYKFEALPESIKNYLINSNAVGDTPIERLRQMNEPSITHYLNHGIDLFNEPLQIALCNQHLNGGISCDIWWESTSIKHLFAIGESNGSHGVHRPGGAALNSGQVGGLRAAQKIGHSYHNSDSIDHDSFYKIAHKRVLDLVDDLSVSFNLNNITKENALNPDLFLLEIQKKISKYGAIVRPLKGLETEIESVKNSIKNLTSKIFLKNNADIKDYLLVKDALFTSLLFLAAILDYHQTFGKSRGSYLILRETLNRELSEKYIVPPGNLKQFTFVSNKLDLSNKIQTIYLQHNEPQIVWEKTREVPQEEEWFETIWKQYSNKEIYD